jgi:glycosyltransferase involved in cell wall biosynthesis
MKILVVCQYYFPENVSVTQICEDLVKRGHNVTVVTGLPNYGFGKILEGYENKNFEEINGVKIHRVNLKPRGESTFSLIRNYLSFWNHSKKFLRHFGEDFDVVYTMSMSPLISVEGGVIFAKKHHIPLIIHCLDLWPESAVAVGKIREGSFSFKILLKWSKKIYSSADKILISSPSFASYFTDFLKIDKPLVLVPQPPLVSPVPDIGIAYKNKTNVVYAGNIGTLQIIENFVEALKFLPKNSDFHLHLIGSGSNADKIANRIKNESLGDLVTYYGPLSFVEAPAYFKNATALIVSLAETTSPVSGTIPNKLLSSLYYGKPILASMGGDGKVVLLEACGSFFSQNDPFSISEAYKNIMDADDATLKRMGDNNLEYFNNHFAFVKIMDLLESEIVSSKNK